MVILAAFFSQVPTQLLFVSRDGRYFRVSGGPRVALSPAGPFRRILERVVRAHQESPRRSLSVAEIFEAGWGVVQSLGPHLLAGRVYSAVAKLRRMGLGPVLTSTQAGYRLDPRCCVIEESPIPVA